MDPNKLNRFMFVWSASWCVNIEDGVWDVFSVLGMCFGQEWNTFSGICQRFCLFVKETHFKKNLVPVLKYSCNEFHDTDILRWNCTAWKTKFSIKEFFSKRDQIRSSVDLVTFTEEILNGKLPSVCSVGS